MEVKGKVKLVTEVIEISEKFKKREIVVTTNEQYPQDIILQATQDRVNLLDGLEDGQDVTVHFNLRGRAWNEKHFNSLEVWKVDKASNNEAPPF